MASDNGSENLHFQLSPVYVIGLSFNLLVLHVIYCFLPTVQIYGIGLTLPRNGMCRKLMKGALTIQSCDVKMDVQSPLLDTCRRCQLSQYFPFEHKLYGFLKLQCACKRQFRSSVFLFATNIETSVSGPQAQTQKCTSSIIPAGSKHHIDSLLPHPLSSEVLCCLYI